jgi:uncharacterized membrane protein
MFLNIYGLKLKEDIKTFEYISYILLIYYLDSIKCEIYTNLLKVIKKYDKLL